MRKSTGNSVDDRKFSTTKSPMREIFYRGLIVNSRGTKDRNNQLFLPNSPP